LTGRPVIAVVIPALDEEDAIGDVVAGFLALERGGAAAVGTVVVADNGSKDRTAERATRSGAVVVVEPERGYGAACLAAIRHLEERPPDIVVFADGDGSNDPRDLEALVAPIVSGEAELVIGSRERRADKGSLTLPQRFGNVLASRMMNVLYGMHYTDLGPFRAIAWPALARIDMRDRDYGWTVEMQVKAAKRGVRVREVDVRNKARIAGRSKVAGTIRGVVGAGYKIVWTILRYR
jgi:glycosyltransferase involved in cell wall biosynthesis